MKKQLLLIVALLVGTIGLRAQTQGIDFTSPTIDFTNGQWSLGYEFSVAGSVTVDGLGMYDDQKNGFVDEAHQVGLWTSSGTLLASAWVSSGNPLLGWFRYATISAVTLGSGNYIVASTTGNDNYTWDPVGFTTAPGITYVGDRFVSSGSLAFPTNSSGVTGWFGGNVRLTDRNSVPDSSATLLMLAGGLGIVAALRRRR